MGRWFLGTANEVFWRVGEDWGVLALAHKESSEQKQDHAAAGVHPEGELWILIDEAAGVPSSMWKTIKGLASGKGDRVLCAYNPTEAGIINQVTSGFGWTVVELSALEHPNILTRRAIVPRAVTHEAVEADIRDSCRDLGPASTVHPDLRWHDFLYALPPEDNPDDEQPRDDGICGHRLGEVRVWRPLEEFAARRLGKVPVDSGGGGLFNAALLDEARQRWKLRTRPPVPPDRVGVDVADGGKDESCACPSWGDDQDTLAYDWVRAEEDGDREALDRMRAERRVYVGDVHLLGEGDPTKVAVRLREHYPRSWWVLENMGDAKSTILHAQNVLDHQRIGRINPSGRPPPRHPLRGEVRCGNFRAAAYVRAAMLVRLGLVDVPPDPLLREELLVMELDYGSERTQKAERKLVAHLIPKNYIRSRLGRSPDRADAFVFSLCRPRQRTGVIF